MKSDEIYAENFENQLCISNFEKCSDSHTHRDNSVDKWKVFNNSKKNTLQQMA